MIDYNHTILARFHQANYAGCLTEEKQVYTAMLGSPAQGAVVKLSIAVANDRITRAVFKAYGSPGLIAAADYLCELIEDISIANARQITATTIADGLTLPRELFGCALLLEDTLRTVLQQLSMLEDNNG